MKKGSETALIAGKKAAETRARNKALLSLLPQNSKVKGMSITKLRFKKLDESNFNKIEIDSPCNLFIHKKLNYIYLSPDRTKVM